MKDEVSLTLVASTGHRVDMPLLPETLVRRRTADGERLELVTHLDDRLGNDTGATAGILSALTELNGDVSELRWGKRRFRGSLSDLTVTETAFQEDLAPIAATIQLTFEVHPEEKQAVSVTVAGERWRQVPDLDTAGPNDPVYEARIGDDGSLKVRFGDGKRGARPPAGEVLARARYRVGGGQTGAN